MSQPLVVGTLVGNPRPASRTRTAALALSEAVRRAAGTAVAPDGPLVDAAELAPSVFEPGATAVREALDRLAAADVLVVASPTYKATYTGLLKAVLDQAPGNWLRGRTAVPLLVAAADRHALAVELHLKPLLAELGAAVPGRGVFVNEAELAADREELVVLLGDRLVEAGWFATPVGVAP
ncbi:NADPH-dependent FMN reductase [Saccharothrix syringae]|uniref:NADPH-dependent oxidoreductase n=1 Tax=Saccharothrix syringae TaxID=103733 RepID=A0A5Q0H581_SACSY|nr:NAD(P)H-dependent oxidoreductase [Saccharothrix syringae]QFZ21143.1 NADPH-dependent oxidoreductase [Saccharothrix syringae]